MRNTVFIIIIGFFLHSCSSIYLDKKELNYKGKCYHFESYETYNVFRKVCPVNGWAEGVLIRKYYEIRLPKNIVYFQTGTEDIFEYPSKQIIYIYNCFTKKPYENEDEWIFRDATFRDVENLYDYWERRGYHINSLENFNNKRISKVYSDGCTTILLFNIKPNNYKAFKNLILTYKYIERNDVDKEE